MVLEKLVMVFGGEVCIVVICVLLLDFMICDIGEIFCDFGICDEGGIVEVGCCGCIICVCGFFYIFVSLCFVGFDYFKMV